MSITRALPLAAFLACTVTAYAETPRNPEVPREFMRLHPCPGGTDRGHTHGACHGYVRDHIIPLCKNGPDTVDNMQWQTRADGKAKDRWECS